MSCNCNNETSSAFNCPCDDFVHPLPLKIGSGLRDLPRQIAGFPEFRRAMLRAIGDETALQFWKGREQNDFGIMLLEMWAYVCDSVSFYDKVIAQESYVRTALLRPSVRRLVALLGYMPRPAVGSQVRLAAFASGRNPFTLPPGTAFRSGSFGNNPPQVFESDKAAVVHPLTNSWTIAQVRSGKLLHDNPSYFLVELKAEILPASRLLLLDYEDSRQYQVLRVKRLELYAGRDGRNYTRLVLQSPALLAKGTPLSRLLLLLSKNNIILDPVASVIETGSEHAANLLRKTTELLEIEKEYDWEAFIAEHRNAGYINTTISRMLPLPEFDTSRVAGLLQPDLVELAHRYGGSPAAVIVEDINSLLDDSDTLVFAKNAERPLDDRQPGQFALVDKNGRAALINGTLDYGGSKLNQDINAKWNPGLVPPVEIFGNLVEASRGQTVANEILGNGDANQANQTFKLSKNPLTYLLSPTTENDQSVRNTLRVYVNGVRWKEVRSFYGIKPDYEVYIVRQDDEGESSVTFGDGIRGKRLPTGTANVIAFYRYGAGQASPPSGAITQVLALVDGLQSIRNPMAAAGGADAEAAAAMQTYAPRSALTLGRAVSIRDMEAVALSIPGVRAVQAEWRWHSKRQCPVAFIFYIGENGIEASVTRRLKYVTDPSTPIAVEQATGLAVRLGISIMIDSRYVKDVVIEAVRALLTEQGQGLLAPERVGIGQPFYRSQLFGVVMSVDGVISVTDLLWNENAFDDFAKDPGAGNYFDFEKGSVLLTGNNGYANNQ